MPAACTSLTSGNDIFPSGRTGTVRHRSGQFFHTVMSSTSSGPIRYSLVMSMVFALRATGATRGVGDGVGAAAATGGGAGAGAADAADAAAGSGVVATGVESAAVAAGATAVASACEDVGGCTFCACATTATHITEQRRTGRRALIEKPLSRVRPDRPAL